MMKSRLRRNPLMAMVLCAVLFLSRPMSANAAIDIFGDVSPSNPALWTINTTGWIGRSSFGQINVDGGSVLQNFGCSLGSNSGSTGKVTVTGAGSQWTSGSTVIIGNFGDGTLNIEAGGLVNGSTCYLGYSYGGTGTATVTGVGSTWSSSYSLYVGNDGSGVLNIEAGGQVSNSTAYLGYYSDFTGTVTVTGAGSTWTNYDLYAGYSGRGTLTVTDGGMVTAKNNLYVGYSGSGTLTVANGGVVTVKSGLFASLNSLFGNGTISTKGAVLDGDLIFDANHGLQQMIPFGTGGAFNLNQNAGGSLGAGYKGNGMLRIADGITVPSYYGYLGYNQGSTGTATVSGTGSNWNNSSKLYVGYSGCGILNIQAGGQS